MSNFATRLRKLREEAGLTQARLGELSGVSKRSIEKLEQDATTGPKWKTLKMLASALGVDCTAFDEDGPVLPQAKKGRPAKKKSADVDPPAEGGAPPKKGRKE